MGVDLHRHQERRTEIDGELQREPESVLKAQLGSRAEKRTGMVLYGPVRFHRLIGAIADHQTGSGIQSPLTPVRELGHRKGEVVHTRGLETIAAEYAQLELRKIIVVVKNREPVLITEFLLEWTAAKADGLGLRNSRHGKAEDRRDQNKNLLHYTKGLVVKIVLFDHAAEAHEGQGKDTDAHQRDRNAPESLGDVVHREVFADTREDDHRQAVAQGGREGIDQRLSEVQHVGRKPEGELLGNHGDRDAEDGAVRGDQGKEDTRALLVALTLGLCSV